MLLVLVIFRNNETRKWNRDQVRDGVRDDHDHRRECCAERGDGRPRWMDDPH